MSALINWHKFKLANAFAYISHINALLIKLIEALSLGASAIGKKGITYFFYTTAFVDMSKGYIIHRGAFNKFGGDSIIIRFKVGFKVTVHKHEINVFIITGDYGKFFFSVFIAKTKGTTVNPCLDILKGYNLILTA